MKRKLAVDIDNTIWDLLSRWLAIYNDLYDDTLSYDMITTYDFFNDIPIKSTVDQFFNILKEDSTWENIEPYEDSYEYLEKLNEEYELYIVTNTSYKTSRAKFNRLFELFPFLEVGQLITIKNKQLLNVDIMIDDCIEYLHRGNYVKLLIDEPYNRIDSRLDDSFIRINNLKEAYEVLKEVV